LNPSYPKTWPIPSPVFFNANNRAYPDVVALGDRILIWSSGSISITAGTSASTPIFAALVSLLNDARLNAGKKQLGFLAPLLYQMQADDASTFNDITVGSSSWSRSSYSCKYGYGCSAGWDPASGLGSLSYQNAVRYILRLP
jgi:tripeptidyl-peptidase-1